jgi:DNA modification methylase|tara:strand:+ start:6288 stop:7679 length:1392 start_codon:yes stop_codon:yes gene_type:complete
MTKNAHKNMLYTGDCLYVMNGINSDSIDLIYLDPPFNSKRMYEAPVGSKAAGISFNDMWTWKDVDTEYLDQLIEEYPFMVQFIQTVGIIHGDGMKAYLTYMAQRIVVMKRILKPTGSFYLHCDPTASHYLKIICDRMFGKNNFKSEIIWKRSNPKNDSKGLGNNNDRILWYVMSKKYTWNKQYGPYEDAYIKKSYRYKDTDGRLFRPGPLDAKSLAGGGYEYEWNGRYHLWRLPKHKMQQLHDAKGIYYSSKGLANRKLYLDEAKGVPLQAIWNDIAYVKGNEDLGYPTQKPLALMHRIIKASSNEGDVVLDPFCGGATTCVAAQQLNRTSLGIDISEKSPRFLIERLQEDGGLLNNFGHTSQYPKRTDIKTEKKSKNVKETLFKEQKGKCKGCNEDFGIKNFEIDHIIPRDKNGPDCIENYQLLCGHCNRVKGNRPMAFLTMRINRINDDMNFKVSFDSGFE